MDPITPPRSSSSSLSWSSWSSPPSVLSHKQQVRVAVIGAGLSGLALGQLLQNAPNVQVTVYEKSLGLDSLSGYRIMVSHFVLRRLHASLSKDIWRKIALSIGISPKDGHELTFMKR
jgi:glycine/D-amino acid oxidase-like deaminating enzyme